MVKIEVKCAHDAMVALEKLIPNPKNPNFHPPKQVEALCKIIKSTGWRAPITISRQSGLIVRGHGRFMAAVEMECGEVPVDYQDYASEAEELADLVADNRIAELSNLDDDLLRDLLGNINSFEFDMELTGFEISEIAELIDTEKQGLIDDDEVPEVVEDPVTKPGDLFYLGGHRLLCGDATNKDDVERLMDGKRADMVFTDPPYGVDYDGGHAVKGKRRQKIKNDDSSGLYLSVLPLLNYFSSEDAPLYLWYSDSHSLPVLSAVLSAGYSLRTNIIWNKNVAQFGAIGAQYKTKHEPCLYCFKNKKTVNWVGPNNEVSVWDISRAQRNDFHPTQKPVELAERAIGNHDASVVSDLFLGSGSTLIACEKLNRKCYGMEIEPHYCDVVVKRWEGFTGKKAELIG